MLNGRFFAVNKQNYLIPTFIILTLSECNEFQPTRSTWKYEVLETCLWQLYDLSLLISGLSSNIKGSYLTLLSRTRHVHCRKPERRAMMFTAKNGIVMKGQM